MKHKRDARGTQRQRGTAAVEFAGIALLFVVFLTVPLFLARCFWHYTVIQKAVHDAALYLATIPTNDMKNQARALDAVKTANYIITSEIADLYPGGDYAPVPTVDCRPLGCGLGIPSTVYVRVGVRMFDPIFEVPYVDEDGLALYADSEMNYVGP